MTHLAADVVAGLVAATVRGRARRHLRAALSTVEGRADAWACAELVPYLDPTQVNAALDGIRADQVPRRVLAARGVGAQAWGAVAGSPRLTAAHRG